MLIGADGILPIVMNTVLKKPRRGSEVIKLREID